MSTPAAAVPATSADAAKNTANTALKAVPTTTVLEDVQGSPDLREVDIDRVGIRGVRHPLLVRRADGSAQPTVAEAALYVRLPRQYKGTHMSRFIELLSAHGEALDAEGMKGLMADMLERLEAEAGFIELRFPYFVSKKAPVTGTESLMDYEVCLTAEQKPGEAVRCTTEVVVAATTLCPCSKKISDYGAHNQRSHITLKIDTNAPVAIEELIAAAEAEASCEVWGLLKRPDEKYVTERAYDNPKFVEDLVRDLAGRMKADDRVDAFSVASENFESIHNHSAYAQIEQDKRASAI